MSVWTSVFFSEKFGQNVRSQVYGTKSYGTKRFHTIPHNWTIGLVLQKLSFVS